MRTKEKDLIKQKGFRKWTKLRVVTLKYAMQRGWGWCNTPGMVLVAAGVLSPYIKQTGLDIPMWLLAVMAFITIVFIGILDIKFRVLHEENLYKSSKDLFLREILDKINELNKKIERIENANRRKN